MGHVIVLETTRSVVESAGFVRVSEEAVRRWAGQVTPGQLRPGGQSLMAKLPGNREQIANLVLLIDALNFCFWGPQPEYSSNGATHRGFDAMLAAMIDAVRRERRWFDARFWCDVPEAELRAALSPAGDLPMLVERERIVRETGRTLLERFDGQFAAAVESVNHRAWDLAALLLCSFDSFRDVAEHRSRPVFLAKRAQITALDLSMAWVEQGHDALDGLEMLTAFADYRLPQALRHFGIIEVSEELAGRIDRGEEIGAGSEQEVELRAATVVAVDEMRGALAARGQLIPAWQIDWYLWDRSHGADISIGHHRTRTIYY